MFVDSLAKYIRRSSCLCSLLSVEWLIIFEDVI